MTAVEIPRARVALSSSSVYPQNCATAFDLAQRLGYDGLEVMVWTDPVSQEAGALKALSDLHEIPVVSVHAPTLLLTQRVWGPDAWSKVDNSIELAVALGAETVVLHPPFRWQKEYAREFADGVALREHDSVAGGHAFDRGLSPALGPGHPALRPCDPGSFAHGHVRIRRTGDGGGTRAQTCAPTPGRRPGLSDGRAPGARSGRSAVLRGARSPCEAAVLRVRGRRGQHPAGVRRAARGGSGRVAGVRPAASRCGVCAPDLTLIGPT